MTAACDIDTDSVELDAVEDLMKALTTALGGLANVSDAMQLSVDCGDPVTDRQKKAATALIGRLVDVIRETAPVVHS